MQSPRATQHWSTFMVPVIQTQQHTDGVRFAFVLVYNFFLVLWLHENDKEFLSSLYTHLSNLGLEPLI